jgi:hypothetical protein
MSSGIALPPETIRAIDDHFNPRPAPYANDPVLWAKEKLGLFLWSKQEEVLEAVRDYPLVAVKAAHDVSKSHTASVAGTWWSDVHPLGSSFLVTTAPSWPQVEAILWREIRRRHAEGNLAGRITLDCKWHMGLPGKKRADVSEELIGFGRKPADYDEYTFQGIHARFFMAILDEAGGIPEWLWNAVLALATNENARVLAIGNPDDPNSHFAQICKPGSGWKVITISAFDSPNFTGEEVPDDLREVLVSEDWVNARRRDWGEGSPIWQAKVLGEFPDISDEYLITPSLLEKCYQLDLPGLEWGRYGIDIARMGNDKSVIYRNRGGQIRLIKEWAKMDTMQSVGQIVTVLKGHGLHKVPAVIDIIGLGAGVFDRLREQRYEVGAYQGSERAQNPAKFKNRRSETWWTFRELMEEGLIDLDPEDETLAAHLGSVKWGVDSAGRIYVESKEDLRERGLPSPDRGDAAVMSTVYVGSPVGLHKDPSSITGDLLTRSM